MSRNEIGFVVAEDEAPLRANLVRKVLAADPSLVCLGAASDGEDALSLVTKTIPQILITDIRMPVLDGLELIERSLQLSPSLGVVIVSGFDDFSYAQRAIRLGVSDFLLKPVQTEGLVSALRHVRSQIDARTREAEHEFGVDGAPMEHLAAYADDLETWLKSHLSEEVRLDELCGRWRLKPSYAVKIYKKRKGITPMRHLTLLRIRKACDLLVTTALQIKQVADLVGYDDPLYFSRVFTRETGCTPSQWRERNLPARQENA